LAGSGLLWQQLQQARKELARNSSDTGATVAEMREQTQRTESLTNELQTRVSLAEAKLAEVSLQRSQLDELMLTVAKSRDEGLLQDLQSALQLAQQQAELTGSVQPLLLVLQSAEQRLGRVAQPRWAPVQRAIERDLERLRPAVRTDLPVLAGRIEEMVRLLDELPFLNSAPHATARTASPASAPQTAATAAVVLPEDASTWQRFSTWVDGVASRTWAAFRAQSKELVRVHRVDRPEAALLAPEQAFFLRENAKLKLLNARLSLLAHHPQQAVLDLRSVSETVTHYFDAQAQSTQLVQTGLSALLQDVPQQPLPQPHDTLAALVSTASGR
jgi:uroporphyrin-3 C-methyltransferase